MTRRLRALVPLSVLLLSYAVLDTAGFAGAASTSSSFTGTTTTERSVIAADGTVTKLDDDRKITLNVSATRDLRGRQEINVSWKGAHPTGGIVADVNSGDAAGEEYPFVLLECRGSGSGATAITPETCWTQTSGERFEKDNSTGYPAWRSDRWADATDRAALVDAPSPRPDDCFRPALAERWVPFKAVDGTTYEGGSLSCAGAAPESSDVGGAGLPSNATYGVTAPDGSGSADFDVWTSDENASLGCTSTVACSLVAVPISGISCDAYATKLSAGQQPPARYQQRAATACAATGQYTPGSSADPGIRPDLAVSGALWWSESNWRNRITVPLTFAAPASICSVVSNDQPVAVYGSVLTAELTAQWQPTFCTKQGLYPFVQVQTSDPSARTLLNTGGINAAFTSRTPDGGFGRPVVQAPLAVTGFAVSYEIDDAKGNKYGSLKLNARLLAKLLSESYYADSLVRANYPALAHNPANLTQDPEFVALNPGLPVYDTAQAAATIQSLASDADLTYALTSYINSDREARAWLNGAADPWGMTVNPNYLGIALPVYSWPLLDNFQLPDSYIKGGNNPCYTYAPAPYLQLIANPSTLMATIVQNLQFGVSNANIACPGGDPTDVSTLRLRPQGREQPGKRFVLGITSLSAAHRYALQTASLQTSLDSPDLSARFTDASGRRFVAPDDAGLRRAAALLTPDATQKTWTLDSSTVGHADGAYPGTLPVYADVPTIGLDSATAKHLGEFLRYAATDGQRPGPANGQLPEGYLPLTKANGLAAQAAYTERAAAAVDAQQGAVPGLTVPVATAPSGTTSTAPVDVPPVTTPGGAAPVVPVGGAAGPVAVAGGASGPSTSPTGGSSASASATTAVPDVGTVGLRSSASYSRTGSLLVPIVFVLALLFGIAGSLLRYPWVPAAAAGAVRRRARRVRSP